MIPFGRLRRRRVSWLGLCTVGGHALRFVVPFVKCSIKNIKFFLCHLHLQSSACSPWPYYMLCSPALWHNQGNKYLCSLLWWPTACLSSLAHNCSLRSNAKISLSFVQLSVAINWPPEHRQARDLRFRALPLLFTRLSGLANIPDGWCTQCWRDWSSILPNRLVN